MDLFKRKIPRDLSPAQLQVILQDEKQESWLIYVLSITIGFAAAARWPAFIPIYATYGGLMLAGLGALFGVNIAHKALNGKPVASEPVEDEEPEDDLPKPPKT